MKPGGYPEAFVVTLLLLVPGLVLSLGPTLLWGKWAGLVGMSVWMLGVCVLVALPPPKP